MILYGSTPPCTYFKEKMDTLLLGIPDVIPGCVLWFFSGVSTGAQNRKGQGETIHEKPPG
jgi:hypothetical protein